VASILVLALPGCSARSKTVTGQAIQTDLRAFKILALQVDAAVSQDAEKEKAELVSETVTRIKNRRVFDDVRIATANENTPGTLLMKATITRLKKIGGGKRMMLGAFAGRANVTVRVQLIDAGTGKEIGASTVTGESGGTGISGGTGDAISKVAEALAKLVA